MRKRRKIYPDRHVGRAKSTEKRLKSVETLKCPYAARHRDIHCQTERETATQRDTDTCRDGVRLPMWWAMKVLRQDWKDIRDVPSSICTGMMLNDVRKKRQRIQKQ